jgi:hypothetical protein
MKSWAVLAAIIVAVEYVFASVVGERMAPIRNPLRTFQMRRCGRFLIRKAGGLN